MAGLFITFEGPDGSGKTTVATAVCQRLEENGIETVHTREPGGIEISEDIRNIILDPKNVMMDAVGKVEKTAASMATDTKPIRFLLVISDMNSGRKKTGMNESENSRLSLDVTNVKK